MQNAVTAQTAQINLKNQQIPPEGPRCVPFSLNFTTSAIWDCNLINFMNNGKISIIQGVWIDNSANSIALTVFNQATSQNVICPPYWQGYFPIFALNPVDVVVSSNGSSATVNVTFYNVPIAPSAWPAVGVASQGTTLVQDVALEGALIGNGFGAVALNYSNADIVRKNFKANQTISARITTAATTTLLTGNPGFFIDWVDIALGPTAIIGVAALVTFSLKDDGGQTIAQKDLWVPSAAGTGAPIPIFALGPDMSWASINSASHLILTLSTALTGGSISVNLGAGVTSQVT